MSAASCTLLGFFAQPEDGDEALRRLRRHGFRRSALVRRGGPRGRTRVVDNDVRPGIGAVVGGTVACAVAAIYLWAWRAPDPAGAGWVLAASVAAGGAALGWLIAGWLDLGVPERVVERYRQTVTAGETLILVELRTSCVREALAHLGAPGGGPPLTFVMREEDASHSETGDAPESRRAQTTPGERLAGERLRAHATQVAAEQRFAGRHPGPSRGGRGLRQRVRWIEAALERMIERTVLALELEQGASPAASMLVHDAYVVRRHVADLRRHVSRGLYDDLPAQMADRERSQPGDAEPRVYGVARDLVHRVDGALSIEDLLTLLDAFQEGTPLTIAELWALPLALRVGLLEQLAELAQVLDRRETDHARAAFWANRIVTAARRDPDSLLDMLAEVTRRCTAPSPHFADRLLGLVQPEPAAPDAIQAWLQRKMGDPLAGRIERERLLHAADEVAARNIMESLRLLQRTDWREVFERSSLVEATLRLDPAGVYPLMDAATRDRYRRAIEHMVRHSRLNELSEVEGARAALAAAGECDHVGHFLLGGGRPVLEAALRSRPPLGERVRRLVRRHAARVYLASVAALTAAALAAVAVALARAGMDAPVVLLLLAAALVPATEVAVQLTNYVTTHLLAPDVLPKLSLDDGVPDDCRSLVVVPMLLLSPDVVRDEIERLEIRSLANPDPNLHFALLADFADAPQRVMPQDEAILAAAVDGIRRLNERHGGAFSLLYRERMWSEAERRWMGWERKRGKLEELNRLLVGQHESHGLIHVGESGRLTGTRFVITLDSDTDLPRDSARRLIGTIAHPLNHPTLSADGRTVAEGYAVIQPRVSPNPATTGVTRFSELFTDEPGIDPYTREVSDAYQDLCGEGRYHGKGIYDVTVFHQLLDGVFPESLLLSHDLVEGAHARVGYASDVELFDSFPATYDVHARRQHRWIRGDWQVMDWSGASVPAARGGRVRNPISLLNRWKVFDNLRRSLVPASTVALLLAGWLVVPAAARVTTLAAVLALLLPAFLPALDAAAHWRRRLAAPERGWSSRGPRDAARHLLRALVLAALLPHQAGLALDAIWRVAYRRFVSGHDLLEWQSYRAASEAAGKHRGTWHQLVAAAGFGAVAFGVTLWHAPDAAPLALPFAALWVTAPAIVAWLDRPHRALRAPMPPEERTFLRSFARSTWRYFETFVGPRTNWLPPDNFQAALRVEVAQRTSPTNIGLWLVSTLTARDLGYLALDDTLDLIEATLGTMGRMERAEGHFLNWYRTETLEPLPPRYVSTVDSGNLLACLWTLAEGCREAADAPVIGPAALHGLADALALIRESARGLVAPAAGTNRTNDTENTGAARVWAERIEDWLGQLAGLLDDPPASTTGIVSRLRAAVAPAHALHAALDALTREYPESPLPPDTPAPPRPTAGSLSESLFWAGRLVHQLDSHLACAERYLAWLECEGAPAAPLGSSVSAGAQTHVPTLRAIAELADFTETEAAPELLRAAERGRWLAGETLDRLDQLAARAERYASEMDLRFLYDAQRHLFSIGYSVDQRRLDSGRYDLLASECRLTSFAAIARGDVPAEHWLALGRPYGRDGGRTVLLSWSGSMFEYLMPLLLTRSFPGSLLHEGCTAAVRSQIEFGRRRHVPWGVSESAHAGIDVHRIYQYRAFGAPGLALRSELDDALVVAPYATALALLVSPAEAVRNLRRLMEVGAGGPYGLYESIDYTPGHQTSVADPGGGGQQSAGSGVVVYAYMAHHQAMSLLATGSVLSGYRTQQRFHGDPRVRATEALLYERVPAALPTAAAGAHREAPPPAAALAARSATRVTTSHTLTPCTHLLSNGRYSVMVTTTGSGYSRWRDLDVTRWVSDPTLDACGVSCYFRDAESGVTWSAGYQPVRREPAQFVATFDPGRAILERRDVGIATRLEVAVSPEDDVEVRRYTLTNLTARQREIEVTSYVELALAPHAAHRAHPAFSTLFVETEALRDRQALLARRIPRAPSESQVWALHVLALPAVTTTGVEAAQVEYETARDRFVGRGRSTANPAAIGRSLSGATGHVLDPAFALRCRVRLEPGARAQVVFTTGAAEDRATALTLADKYREPAAVTRALDLAWWHAQLEARRLRVGGDDLMDFQALAARVIFPGHELRAPAELVRQNALGTARLWAHGISGDLPIVLVHVEGTAELPVVEDALRAHSYWRSLGLTCDLVILDGGAGGYRSEVGERLAQLASPFTREAGADVPGGIFLRRAELMAREDVTLLQAAARVVLVGARGSLAQQLAQVPSARPTGAPPAPPPARARLGTGGSVLAAERLIHPNGLGGFTPDGKAYVVRLGAGMHTPAPWVNVLANPGFGALVSESGQGFVWQGNSQSNRLLPWSNDPVLDPAGDALYIRDEATGEFWSPTPAPIRDWGDYRACHGLGHSTFSYGGHDLDHELTAFVPLDASGGVPLRVLRLRLRNRSARARVLSVTYFAEWVLGAFREETQLHVVTAWDPVAQALLARNAFNPDYARHVAFAAASRHVSSYTADRREFLGRDGARDSPAGMAAQRLSGSAGAALDPCAALRVMTDVAPGGAAELTFVIGQAADSAQMRVLVERFREPERVAAALQETSAWWEELLGGIQVETPDPETDTLLNGWLLYQTLACRVWGRSGFYQSGGAYGFRDQLQDVLALVYARPSLARAHLLRAAARQFVEGDVQHWWHPQSGAGSRTRSSDDLLWLPFAVEHYVRITGDVAVLDEVVPFLMGPALAPHEDEAYGVPGTALEAGTLLEHCRRAVERVSLTGPHGLPLMGSGDWNDGMNRVGVGGRGESVWLAWFVSVVLRGLASLIEQRTTLRPASDGAAVEAEMEAQAEAERLRERATRITEAIEREAWDGEWYRRAYDDAGAPLGSQECLEAKIDSLPQSWAVLSGAADPMRRRSALAAANRHLVRERDRLVLLFTPPFQDSPQDPGYIKSYPPGVRENGGQYTHAAVWLAMAFAREGDGDRAVELLRMLNPMGHSATPDGADRYRVEPYVVAADVYALPDDVGRGGWTWYTGSSAWLYRAWLEEVLGLTVRGTRLSVNPALPKDWPSCRIRYRRGAALYDIRIENPHATGRGVDSVALDGQLVPEGTIELLDDGREHAVVVSLGRSSAGAGICPGQPLAARG